jgi:hypothetical protein
MLENSLFGIYENINTGCGIDVPKGLRLSQQWL